MKIMMLTERVFFLQMVNSKNNKSYWCESDPKLEKLKFTEAVKIRVRFEKSEHDFLEQN